MKRRSIAASALFAMGLLTSTASAVTLSLNPGDTITFNTTTGTYSGTVAGSGTIVNGVAHFGFDSVNLPTGVSVTLTGDKPMSLVSYNDLSINTTLNASGQGQTGRVGGFNGGNIGTPPQVGQGPGGGGVTSNAGGCCWGGGGGGYGGAGGTDVFATFVGKGGVTYGDAPITTLLGGSGGGGGGGCCGSTGNVGGAGGGAVAIFAEGNATFGSSAQFLVDGADGNPGNQSRTGGGGSGGSLKVTSAGSLSIAPGALLSAQGGDSGTGIRVGGGGGGGRVALLTNSLNNLGTVNVAGGFSNNTADAGNENGQAGTIFTGAGPAQLATKQGLKLWLDATDLSTITMGAGTEITQWRDKSGNGNDANAAATKRPQLIPNAIGGQNALAFNRDQLTVSDLGIANGQDRTLFMVFEYDTLTQNSEIFGTSTAAMVDVGTFTQSQRLRLRDATNGGPGDDGFNGIYTGTGSVPLGSHIVTITAEAGGGTTIMSDGVVLRDDAGSFFHYALTGNVGIGGAFFSGREFIGNLSEVLVYDRVLSASEANLVGVYLEEKYSLNTAFAIPEPASASMLLLAGAALLRRRRAA